MAKIKTQFVEENRMTILPEGSSIWIAEVRKRFEELSTKRIITNGGRFQHIRFLNEGFFKEKSQ